MTLAAASTTLADTPATWHDGPSISALHALAIFAGIPLLVMLAVSLLVFAPSLVRGPRYRPGQPWEATSEWFGVRPGVTGSAGQLEAGSAADETGYAPGPDSGGASATW